MPRSLREQAPLYLAGASAASITVSIATSQILLGLAIAALLLNYKQIRWPRAMWPLLAFMVWTLVSLAASPDPRDGLSQVKKFFVYLMLVAVFSAVRSLRNIQWIAMGSITGATLSAIWGMVQTWGIWKATGGVYFFIYLVNTRRATGFLSHWMTFSGVTMMAMMITAAWWLFSTDRRRSNWFLAAFGLLSIGLLIALQRGQWAGAVVGLAWLMWSRRPILVLTVPLAVALLLTVAPVRRRAMDLFQPELNTVDVAEHRSALRATGLAMVRDHPWVGVGPQQVTKRFYDYAPAYVPRPVPSSWSIEHLHNLYIHYAAERGLPALVALLWFLGTILLDLYRARLRSPETRWIVEAAIACTLGIMVAGWGEVNLGDSEPLAMFLGVVACAYAAREIQIPPA